MHNVRYVWSPLARMEVIRVEMLWDGGDAASLYLPSGIYSPAKTRRAGPVIMHRFVDSSHSINRSPPGSVTVAERSDRPSSTAATSKAHAPVPHASVGPAPRSHTFILRWVRDRT
eukprot:scaffold147709_cov36-Tisochrysis_lutea.AAC.1